MGQRTTNLFTCDGCPAEQEAEAYIAAPHGWRVLTWNGGYVGDEKREAHYCPDCRDKHLKALDVLLGRAFAA